MRFLWLVPFLVGFEMFFHSDSARSEPVSAAALDLAAGFHEVAAPTLQIGCNAMCVSPCGTASQHMAQAHGALGTVNPHTDCKPFSDCVGHPSCHNSRLDPPGLDRLGALVALVASGSLSAVGAIRSEFGDIALYNPDRAALQIVGCNADVLSAHVPMSKEQLAVWRGASN
jgi:hypothetical protein